MSDLTLVVRTTVGHNLFELWKVPGEWKWVTIGLAGYDGYARNEHDSLVRARSEFNGWVEESTHDALRRLDRDR